MQQLNSTIEPGMKLNGERKRVERVVEALATLGNRGETLSEVAHDARNMVTALGLYCDLLEEPGVLAVPFAHYAQELRLVAAASRRLVEKLVALDARFVPPAVFDSVPLGPRNQDPNIPAQQLRTPRRTAVNPSRTTDPADRGDLLPALPVPNLAAELLANRNLLAALAGPSIAVTVDAQGGARPVRITTEDLTRVLVNLVKNAAEAMPKGGRIHLSVSEQPAASGTLPSITLAIEDNGPGIPGEALDKIFTPGFTTRGGEHTGIGNVLWGHRGLGLSITRSIIEAAGGRISASNRPQGGARFTIDLPVRKSFFPPLAAGN